MRFLLNLRVILINKQCPNVELELIFVENIHFFVWQFLHNQRKSISRKIVIYLDTHRVNEVFSNKITCCKYC